MQKTNKLGKITKRVFARRALIWSISATAIFMLSFLVVPYVLAEANATTASLDVNWGAVTLELDPDVAATEEYISQHSGASRSDAIAVTGHGNVDFGTITPTAKDTSLSPANYGTLRIVKKTVGVETTGRYYTVYLSMSGSETALKVDGTSVSIPQVNDGAQTPTYGAWSAPITFSASGWGYAVPDTNIATSSSVATSPWNSLCHSGGTCTNLYSGAGDTNLNTDLTSVSGGTTYSTTTWAGVPAKGSAQQVYKAETNSSGGFGYSGPNVDTNNVFDIYYGVMADNNVMAGTYTGEVLYTAIASAASLDATSTNLARYYKFGGKNDTQTIAVDLTSSTSIITESDLKVYLVPHATMSSANYDVSGLDASDYTGHQCTGISNLDRSNNRLTFTCTMPAEATGDEYDYWVAVSGYNYNYVSKIDNGAKPGFVYAGLQTKDGSGNYYVTKMQEMTAGVCNQTNKWNNKWGDAARILDPSGNIIDDDEDGESDYPTVTASLATGVGSFNLTDTRDGKRYVVRRMADGNCWMAQNLDLDLYSGMTLSASDTNLDTDWTLSSTTAAGTANSGSTSSYWQAMHGVETATLYKRTYNFSTDAWNDATTVESCTGGTQQLPCYTKVYNNDTITANSISYWTITDDGNTVTRTASDKTTYDAGNAYGQWTFNIRKMSFGSGKYASNDVSASSCTMYVTKTGRVFVSEADSSYGYCYVTTTGAPAVTQYGDNTNGTTSDSVYGMSNKGYQTLSLPVISYAGNTPSTTAIPVAANADVNTGRAGSTNAINTNTNASHAGDYRWRSNGDDGAHVYEPGIIQYTNNKTDANITYVAPDSGTDPASLSQSAAFSCSGSYGTTSGTLALNGNTIEFPVCLDSDNKPLATTGAQGNWYNWYAATAGRGTSGFTGTSVEEDICPKGWQLPYGTQDNKSFYNLITTTLGRTNSGSNRDVPILAAPLSYLRSGYYDWGYDVSGGPRTQSYYGAYWSSTRNGLDAINPYFSSDFLYGHYLSYRGWGLPIRCVAQ